MEVKSSFSVLFFPWLAHGHVFPFLELAKKLSQNNFRIYFCSTSVNLDSVRKSLSKNQSDNDVSIELVELNLPSTSELPPQYHTTKNIPPHLMPTLMQSFQMSSSHFFNIISSIKPDLLIYDGFQPWAAKFASSQGIPSVIFSITGSAALSFFHHLHTYKSFDTFPHPSIYLHEHEKRDLISQGGPIKVEDAGDGFAFGTFQLSCDIVLIKSCCKGIEEKYFDYFSELCHKKIIPVGTLLTYNNEENSSEILSWLSEKNECSVLYISFGSENYLSKEQMGEMAKGLELSNVNFIWVARLPSGSSINIEETLPLGFLERVKQRGVFVQGWAPQAEILAHKSVGGFMSHCGWSSVVESVYFGIPVVAVPLKLDQPVNSRLVVEVGAGVEVRKNEHGEFRGEELAKTINMVIGKENGEGFRCKVRELSEKMKIEEKDELHEVVERLSSICVNK